jgi:small subunit ribosomal protein S1
MEEREQDIKNNQEEMFEEHLKSLENLENGQIVDGVVVQITEEYVFLDVGLKSEGKVAVSEFEELPKLNDKVAVEIVRKESANGEVVVSKKKAEQNKKWKVILNAYKDKTPVEGVFTKAVKNGIEVLIENAFTGFVPISKIDISRVENAEKWEGKKSKFLILNKPLKKKIILSRRDWLVEDVEKRKKEFFENVKIGDNVEGAVKSFTSFGAFIDLGGFDGLLHINDMSWGHVAGPRDYVKKGQKVTLKVIHLDEETQKINLSLKHFQEDPWNHFEAKYQADDVVKGKVTKLVDFGVFIELEDGIEGLAHISELSWVKRIDHPKEILNIGDDIECKILDYNIQEGRVSLGIKQVMDNPWDSIAEKYPEGTKLTKKIVKVTNSGAFIELEEGIDGFLHVDDLSWTKKIKNAGSVLKKDEEIEVVVISINPDDRRIRLGVKQLSDNPWEALAENIHRGSEIEGEITNITDFGMFVKVSDEIEGLIGVNQVPRKDESENPLEGYKVGDTVKAAVLEVNLEKQRVSLSIRALKKKQQRAEISKYIHDDDEPTASMADFFKDNE